MDDTGRMIKRVNALDRPTPDAEDTLMDGYARVLELEAERVRLERRFEQLAGRLAEDRDSGRLLELRPLKERIASTEEELRRLRTALAAVRQRLASASATAAAADAC